MPTLTIRGVPEELISTLHRLKTERKASINSLVLEALERTFATRRNKRDLSQYVTWTEEDRAELQASFDEQRRIDGELWR